jgi:hypothetical protein
MIPSEVALLVRWKTQMDSAKLVMLDARMEMACPARTMIKARIPLGRLGVPSIMIDDSSSLPATSFQKSHYQRINLAAIAEHQYCSLISLSIMMVNIWAEPLPDHLMIVSFSTTSAVVRGSQSQ